MGIAYKRMTFIIENFSCRLCGYQNLYNNYNFNYNFKDVAMPKIIWVCSKICKKVSKCNKDKITGINIPVMLV